MRGNLNWYRILIIGLIVTLACAAIAAALFLATLNNIFGGACESRVIRNSVSPDGQLKAVLFERNCGATTSLVTELAIAPARSRTPLADNDVVSTEGLGKDRYYQLDGARTHLDWRTRRALDIHCGPPSRAQQAIVHFRGVAVAFDRRCVARLPE